MTIAAGLTVFDFQAAGLWPVVILPSAEFDAVWESIPATKRFCAHWPADRLMLIDWDRQRVITPATETEEE